MTFFPFNVIILQQKYVFHVIYNTILPSFHGINNKLSYKTEKDLPLYNFYRKATDPFRFIFYFINIASPKEKNRYLSRIAS